DWQDSLASLDQVKARAKEFEAMDWFLTAMNLQRSKRRAEAQAAFRKGGEWIGGQQREAEDNAFLRLQYELRRPAIDGLKREAEDVLEGKDAAETRKG